MSVTAKQQELIDGAIATFIENYDRIAASYLAIRQSILALGDAPAPHKVKQLQYELEKCRELYALHVETLLLQQQEISALPFTQTADLGAQHAALQRENSVLHEEIDNLTAVQKPLLDDMRALMESFASSLDHRTAKKFPWLVRNGRLLQDQAAPAAAAAAAPAPKPHAIDHKNLVFDVAELKDVFGGIQDRLSARVAEDKQIKVRGYLDEYLENGKSMKRLEGGKYLYDVSLTGKTFGAQDKGAGGHTVAEYDQMIDDVIHSIEDLIESGAEARDRWSGNAMKLDIIKEAMDAMDSV